MLMPITGFRSEILINENIETNYYCKELLFFLIVLETYKYYYLISIT